VLSPVEALTQLAQAAYARSDTESAHVKWAGQLGVIKDPDRWQVMALAARDCFLPLRQAVAVLSSNPDLAVFRPLPNTPVSPAIVYPGGSIGKPFSEVIVSLLVSAAQRYYFLREPINPEGFVTTVLENYQQLLRLGRGQPVEAYVLVGFTGITLAEDAQVETPWGVLRPDSASSARS
jgi:hypothetical protein